MPGGIKETHKHSGVRGGTDWHLLSKPFSQPKNGCGVSLPAMDIFTESFFVVKFFWFFNENPQLFLVPFPPPFQLGKKERNRRVGGEGGDPVDFCFHLVRKTPQSILAHNTLFSRFVQNVSWKERSNFQPAALNAGPFPGTVLAITLVLYTCGKRWLFGVLVLPALPAPLDSIVK